MTTLCCISGTHLKPCQASKMENFAKIVNSFHLRRLIEFWIRLCIQYSRSTKFTFTYIDYHQDRLHVKCLTVLVAEHQRSFSKLRKPLYGMELSCVNAPTQGFFFCSFRYQYVMIAVQSSLQVRVRIRGQ